ncbi:MAG: site-specific recombinase XerD [Mycobacterium sp.]|jgi:hypothetical protein|nr:site-specific recombinase XerD [Mycobacterium sp.]MDT5069084.1 hypothetical protein [Mycobacterium sp.]MDT5175819.1 hypothetical protein [Mycobacterium sp.]
MTARHGSGRRWLARWVDHDGQERSKAFERKADAQRKVNGVTAALASGTYADPQRSATTFGTVAGEWFSSKATLAPKTVGGYRGLLDNIILPKWQNVSLRDIDHVGMQSWVS